MQGGKPEIWNGVKLVGTRRQELKGQRGLLEEIHKDKVEILGVGGV